jgi:hypothetical protein
MNEINTIGQGKTIEFRRILPNGTGIALFFS